MIIGPAAYPSAATITAAAPRTSPGFALRSIPTRATTPASPISIPSMRVRVGRSVWSKRSASSAISRGTVAITIAATEESTCCSPAAISGNGRTISTVA